MSQLKILIKKLNPAATIPTYKRPDDAGFDFICPHDFVIPANSAAIMPTGLAFAIPPGYEMQIRMRSSAAKNTPLIIPNSPGTIDAGYRGEVGILLRNLSNTDYKITKGERIAQGVIASVMKADFTLASQLPESPRNTGGFGSTGER